MKLRAAGRWLPVLALAGCARAPEAPPPTPGVNLDTKTVSIGVLNDESGPVALIGRAWGVGMKILAREVNSGESDNLPKGWKIQLVERDHGYEAKRAAELLQEMRGQVLFLGTSFGTPITLALRPLLQREGMVAFPGSLSSKHAEFELTPPIGPSYRLEAMRGLDWMVKHNGKHAQIRLGLVYQQDDYGNDGRAGTLAAAEALGLKVVSEQAVSAGQLEYATVVGGLKQAGATHVMLSTVPASTAPILALAAQTKFTPIWVGNSPSWMDRFFDARVVPPEIFSNFYWATSFPYWGENLPVMKRFLLAYDHYGRDLAAPDYYILAAYCTGMLEMQVLRRTIESGDLTRAGFLKALRSEPPYDTLGATPPLSFAKVPYETSPLVRVLKPDFTRAGWSVAGPYAAPTTYTPAPEPEGAGDGRSDPGRQG